MRVDSDCFLFLCQLQFTLTEKTQVHRIARQVNGFQNTISYSFKTRRVFRRKKDTRNFLVWNFYWQFSLLVEDPKADKFVRP